MDFENLKNSQSNFDKLTKQIESNLNPEDNAKTKNKYQDDRLWKPELDKTGNGYAVLRFLPAPQTEEMPWARVWSHAFQGPGGWYIENSLTTLGQKDPVSEENTILWNTGVDSDKEIARKRKRKLSYYSNVYVVSDPKHPENEGKVFLFKFGKKIFDKITEAMQPAFEDEKAINPFDFWTGANFKLKIRKVDGFWNYDKSEFEAVSPITTDDEAIKGIWNKQYPLKPFLEAANFKSYDELKEKYNRVVAGSKNTETASEIDLPPITSSVAATPVATASVQSNEASSGEDDDTLSYFSKLAEDE
jgi:hypothetical protein|tara:strand:+ start:110346 stop:111254 length:909 start_codon:yes stop_codon:yes gene_type:complete